MGIYRKQHGRRVHVLMAEKALGGPLPKGAVVHHVDGDGANNEAGNLVICPSQKYHALLHYRTQALQESGNANYKRCKFCKAWGDDSNLHLWGRSAPKRGDAEYFHRACVNEYNYTRKLRVAGTAMLGGGK